MSSSAGTASGAAPGAPVIKFRNYQPKDAALVGGTKAAAAAPSGQPTNRQSAVIRPPIAVTVAPPPAPSVVLAQKEAAETAQLLAKAKDVDSVVIAPKKPNWDLKRDIAPRLELLERRTQHAIADLLRERVTQAALAKSAAASGIQNVTSAVSGPGRGPAPRGAGVASSGAGASSSAASAQGNLDEQYEAAGIDSAALARAVMEQGGGEGAGEVEESAANDDDGGKGGPAATAAAPGKRRRYDDE